MNFFIQCSNDVNDDVNDDYSGRRHQWSCRDISLACSCPVQCKFDQVYKDEGEEEGEEEGEDEGEEEV